jgi:hypothetical protein
LIWIDPSGESVAQALAGALGTDDKKSRLDFLRLLLIHLDPSFRATAAKLAQADQHMLFPSRH